jgi:hypothetical protein
MSKQKQALVLEVYKLLSLSNKHSSSHACSCADKKERNPCISMPGVIGDGRMEVTASNNVRKVLSFSPANRGLLGAFETFSER